MIQELQRNLDEVLIPSNVRLAWEISLVMGIARV